MKFKEINPSPRTLMTPGPVEADPRVLRAMGAHILGQFDPEFTALMNETSTPLYRGRDSGSKMGKTRPQ